MYIDEYQRKIEECERKKEADLISKEQVKEIIEQAEKEMTAGLKHGNAFGLITSVCGIIKCKVMLYEPEQPES
jgi:uncharacterized ferredoxin-like protein